MLKKTLIATAALGATLLAAATLLPALAQTRSTAPAGPTSASAQAPVEPRSSDPRGAADDSGPRTSTQQSERTVRREHRHGDEGRGGSSGTNQVNDRSHD